jgi:hypothetical protein
MNRLELSVKALPVEVLGGPNMRACMLVCGEFFNELRNDILAIKLALADPYADPSPAPWALYAVAAWIGVIPLPTWTRADVAHAVRCRRTAQASRGTRPHLLRLAQAISGTKEGVSVWGAPKSIIFSLPSLPDLECAVDVALDATIRGVSETTDLAVVLMGDDTFIWNVVGKGWSQGVWGEPLDP